MTTPPSHSPADSVGRLLATEYSELKEFRALLAREQTLLQNADVDGLIDLTEIKSALATRLAESMQRREQALTSAGFKTGREGMEAWLASQPAAAEVHADWRQLLELAQDARREHEINGKLIAVHLQHNQQALAALMAARGRPLTYGPDGQQKIGVGGGRTLGSA